MFAIQTSHPTPADYLHEERKRIREIDGKYEYINGKLIFMPGASTNHNIISGNIYALLWIELRNRDYIICQSDQRVHHAKAKSYLYPDVVVIPAPPQYADEMFDTVINPQVLVEVLSESTEAYDRGENFLIYRQMDSFREYVMIAQDKHLVEVFYKESGDTWQINTYRSEDETVHLQSLDVRLAIKDIYNKVDWSRVE